MLCCTYFGIRALSANESLNGATLIVKDSSGTILRNLDIKTIYSVQSASPGVVIIEPLKGGITLAGGNTLRFDFRLSLDSQFAWKMSSLVQVLPPPDGSLPVIPS